MLVAKQPKEAMRQMEKNGWRLANPSAPNRAWTDEIAAICSLCREKTKASMAT